MNLFMLLETLVVAEEFVTFWALDCFWFLECFAQSSQMCMKVHFVLESLITFVAVVVSIDLFGCWYRRRNGFCIY